MDNELTTAMLGLSPEQARDSLLDTWLARVPLGSPAAGEQYRQRMRELVLLFRDYIEDPNEDVADDVRASAYELAVLALQDMDRREMIRLFRDALRESLLHHVRIAPNTVPVILTFMDLVTDSYWRAYSDKLRRAMRLQHREARSQELRLAKRIQQRLLPKTIPNIPGFQIAGRLIPAAEVGGDYWSVRYYEKDGVVTTKLADISGHGIAAATLVAAVKFISGGFYPSARSARWVMERTNHVLVKETPADILVTMVYGWLRPHKREMDYVNAGHAPVLFLSNGDVQELPPTGPVLGLMETTYEEIKLHFRPGDILLFCSDGVVDARGPDPFGKDRLVDILLRTRDRSVDEIADTVVKAVMEHASNTPSDDISLVVLKALP
ncbi:MAG: PP2C family protein-serine/threonine phosphatase [Armatimonadota bacterium]